MCSIPRFVALLTEKRGGGKRNGGKRDGVGLALHKIKFY